MRLLRVFKHGLGLFMSADHRTTFKYAIKSASD